MDLTGKIALVTGCNAGIGYETIRVLAQRGAEVFGLARTLEKATDACNSVNAARGMGRAVPFACEHTNFQSVVDCTDAIERTGKPIDMVICNAGIYFLPQLELAQGLEKHFVVNHLSHFILVTRLLDRVRAANAGRVVVVGSDAYKLAPTSGIEFDNLSGQRYYDPAKMYGQSKLANGLFARELARRLRGSRVTSNVVHPGWVMTETMRSQVNGKNFSEEQMAKAKTVEQGAATPCYVASHPDVKNVTGEYFEDCNVVIPTGHMRDDDLATRLWVTSETLVRDYLRATGTTS